MALLASLTDLIGATAQNKFNVARARRSPDLTAEKPREAIFDALNMVGDAIAANGFVYVPSGSKFVRKNGDFTFEISIQSDRNNVAGQRAAVWVHTAIYSKSLNDWRKKHASDWIRPKSRFPGPVYGNQLGYLCDPAGWTEWDFADHSRRREIADDLIASIRVGAFPLFAVFEGEIEGVTALADQDWPSPEGILGYLLSVGHAEHAAKVLDDYLANRPGLMRQFEPLLQQFVSEGLPLYRGQLPHDLAAFAAATGHPWRSNKNSG